MDFLEGSGIVELLKEVLPKIIDVVETVFSTLGNFFFGEKQRKVIESWLLGMVIPPLKRKIREEITNIIAPAIETMRNNVQQLWLKKLENHRDQIGKAIEEKKSGAYDIEKMRQTLEGVRDEVKALGEEVRGV